MSFSSVSSISELLTTMAQYSARSSCESSSLCISEEKPTMALSGVRISWLMLARNADLSMSDSSAFSRATTSWPSRSSSVSLSRRMRSSSHVTKSSSSTSSRMPATNSSM